MIGKKPCRILSTRKLKMNLILALILMAPAGDIVLKDLEPGTHYLKVEVSADGSGINVSKLPAITINNNPTPVPPAPTQLSQAVAELAAKVPDHKNKANVMKALSASYLALSKEKNLPLDKIMAARKAAHNLWVTQFASAEYWEQFDKDLISLLNKHDPDGSKMSESLASVAKGLDNNFDLTPEFIQAIAEVITGLIEGKGIVELLPAILKVVMGLLG
jgi:hypothetical protein